MKHLLLSATLLLFAGNLIAQLHVRPNPTTSTDSYIYANDVVLYVQDGIDLHVNNDPETQASIYLRGDAQLIQGDKPTSQNSGNGHLSVWQRGYANAFDYNYWASPVGNPNQPAAGNSRFGIPWLFDVRESTPNTLHLTYSTPQPFTTAHNGEYSDVPAGQEGTLRVSRRWIYTMRAQSGYANWIYINQQDGSGTSGLAAGEGFTMKGTGTLADGTAYQNAHAQLYDFRGRPNDGTITAGVATGQETLVGNPYPSALDMREFLLDPSNGTIDGSAYYWDQNRATNTHLIRDYEGGYGAWQPNGGAIHPIYGDLGLYEEPVFIMYDGSGNPLSGDVGIGEDIERRFAPIGQGFMVRGTANGNATFTNDMRRHVGMDPAYSQFRNTGGASSLTASAGAVIQPEEPVYASPLLRFQVEVNDSYVRGLSMIFSPETTKGADRGWDSKHPSVISAGDAYWLLEDETDPYVIQSRPFDEFDVIPLGIRKDNGNASYKVKVVESHGFSNNMFLYDVQNNIYQRLDTENSAQINLNGPADNVDNRFFIVFRRNIQDDNVPQRIADMNLDVFQNNPLSKLQVSNPDMFDIKNATVYDMRGRMVISENNLGKVPRYEFSTQGLSSGVYLVVLTTQDDQMIDYKITVHNKN